MVFIFLAAVQWFTDKPGHHEPSVEVAALDQHSAVQSGRQYSQLDYKHQGALVKTSVSVTVYNYKHQGAVVKISVSLTIDRDSYHS